MVSIWRTVFIVLVMLPSCAIVPNSDRGRAVLGRGLDDLPEVIDRRGEFAQTFCARLAINAPSNSCDNEIWPAEYQSAGKESTTLDTEIYSEAKPVIILVGGAFEGCFGPQSVVWPEAESRLSAMGFEIYRVPVISRSGSAANAKEIKSFIDSRVTKNRSIMLLGYSKGVVDSLSALAMYPDLAERVVALIGVAGPYAGSQLADIGEAPYRALFKEAFPDTCNPGDGEVLASLSTRSLAQLHTLPLELTNTRFYSLSAWPASERLAWILEPASQLLAVDHPANDGQVGVGESLIPGVHWLGVVNSDHWGVGLALEDAGGNVLFANSAEQQFPRYNLLESLVLFAVRDVKAEGQR